MTVIGIDLGTTNSLVAYWTGSAAEIIPNNLGNNLTPSVVSIDNNGEILVGQIAKERMITHPDKTAANFKRYMGTEKTYRLDSYSFTPIELSAFVIKSLKADAEAFLGQPVEEAIISVPAYFNDVQRKATKQSAELAGLRVERLISEPTAAAISYGLHQKEENTSFLVFDIGGGTFDVSVLEMFEGIMEVQSIAGDNFLGGEDFTKLLEDSFIYKNKLDTYQLDIKILTMIKKQAEICKRQLSSEQKGSMGCRISEADYGLEIDRSGYERLAAELLLRLRNPIERALRDAQVTPNELDAVILVGGATRMPVIRNVVSKMFGKLPYSNINPDEAVALGAAIQAALKERDQALNELILTDVCPYSLGVEVVKTRQDGSFETGYFLPIIERNTTIPVSRVERLNTVADNQKVLQLEIYQGESMKVENNIKLGELKIKLSPAPAGEQQVDVRYTYDINGILEVEATSVNTGKKKTTIIEKSPGSLTADEIKSRLKKLEALKMHPREKEENRLILARGERMYEESLGSKRTYVSDIISEFEAVLASQDEKKIKKAALKVKTLLDELEGRYDF